MKQFLFSILSTFLFSCHESNKPKVEYYDADSSLVSLSNSYFQSVSTTESKSVGNEALFPGQGFNSNTGQRMDAIVVDSPLVTQIHSKTEKFGQEVYLEFKLINSYEELRTSMSVDVAASLQMGAFKGSSEVRLLNSKSFNNFSTYLLMNMQVRNPTLGIDPQSFKLTPKARQLVTDPNNFVRTFGNEFVSSIETGGTLYILFEYKSANATERKELNVKLSAQVKQLFGKVKMTAAIQNTFEKIEWSNSTNVNFAGTGVCGKMPAMHKDSLVEYMRNFPDMVSPNNCPFVIGVSKMSNSVLSEITNKHMFDIFTKQKYFLQDCAYKKDSLKTLLGNLKYIRDNKDEFESVSLDKVESMESLVQTELRKLDRIVNECAQNMACSAEALNSVVIPKYKYTWIGGNPNPSISMNDKMIDSLKLFIPVIIDTVKLTPKTFEIRGQYSVYNIVSKKYEQVGINEKFNHTYQLVGDLSIPIQYQLYLLVYDIGSRTIIDKMPYVGRPITIERKNSYVMIRCEYIDIIGHKEENVPLFLRQENEEVNRGLHPPTIKASSDNPMHVMVY